MGQTYGELRRRKRATSTFEDTRDDINAPVNDRSPDNYPDDMRDQARDDLYRSMRAVDSRTQRRVRRRG